MLLSGESASIKGISVISYNLELSFFTTYNYFANKFNWKIYVIIERKLSVESKKHRIWDFPWCLASGGHHRELGRVAGGFKLSSWGCSIAPGGSPRVGSGHCFGGLCNSASPGPVGHAECIEQVRACSTHTPLGVDYTLPC